MGGIGLIGVVGGVCIHGKYDLVILGDDIFQPGLEVQDKLTSGLGIGR
jgi:hypothetical protein